MLVLKEQIHCAAIAFIIRVMTASVYLTQSLMRKKILTGHTRPHGTCSYTKKNYGSMKTDRL